MSDYGLGNKGGEGDEDNLVSEEEGEEAIMEIEEIEQEPKDSKKVKRCSSCRRMVFGHTGVCGKECKLERIENDDELEKDDKVKNEIRKKKRDIMKKVKENVDMRDLDEERKLMEQKDKALKRLNAAKNKNKETRESKAAEERKSKLGKEMKELEKEIEKEEEKNRYAEKKKTEEKDRERKDEKKREERKKEDAEEHKRKDERKREDRKKLDGKEEQKRKDEKKMEDERRKHGKGRQGDQYRNNEGRSNRGYSNERRRDCSNRMERDPRKQDGPRRTENEQRREGSRRTEDGSVRSNDRYSTSSSGTNRESSRISRTDAKGLESLQETLASSMVDAIVKLNENVDRGKDPPPAWEKTISFLGWRRSVEVWADTNLKPSKKANLLLELIKKDTDHGGLKELIIQEVIENEEFDYKKEDVIKDILDKIEAFVEESKWTKNVKLAKELLDFKQKSDEDLVKYVIRFTALEAKLKNEKVQMNNMFKTSILLNQSNMGCPEKSNIMASIDMNNEIEVLEKVKKKIRESFAVNKETKESFIASTIQTKEPVETMYGNFQRSKERGMSDDRGRSRDRGFQREGNYSSRSKDRNQFRSRDRNNFRSRDRNNFRSRDRNNFRSNSRDWRNKPREGGSFNNTDGKSPGENRPKRTYKVEKINFDIDKSVFENEIENKMLIDSGCPEMVCGEAWLKTYESSCGRKFQMVGKIDNFKLGNETFKTIKTVKIP